VQLRIAPDTGAPVGPDTPNSIVETFMVNHLPGGSAGGEASGGTSATNDTSGGGEPIF
jgi:hypothetical protein